MPNHQTNGKNIFLEKGFLRSKSFSKDFSGHDFEIIVDNPKTHIAQEYSLLMFGMKHGARFPVKQICWIDENNSLLFR